jgi:hypothetical protein
MLPAGWPTASGDSAIAWLPAGEGWGVAGVYVLSGHFVVADSERKGATCLV